MLFNKPSNNKGMLANTTLETAVLVHISHADPMYAGTASQQNEEQGQVSTDLQQEGEALQGEALASDHCSADALRAVLELSQHDGHVVGSCQRHHHHPISLLGCCTACKKMQSGFCWIWSMSSWQMTYACMHGLDCSGKHSCGMQS